MNVVKLSANVVLSPSFTRAIQRLSEARGLSQADHQAAVSLVRRIQQAIAELKAAKESGESDKLPELLAKDITFENCSLSGGVVAQASLAPADTIALGVLIKGV
jgi:protein involved in polysaccharide export with SLBB domain